MSDQFPPFPSSPEPPSFGTSDPNDLSRPLREATFQQAAQRFFKKYADFNTRSSRSEFWWWILLAVIIGLVLSVLGRAAGFFMIIYYLWALATIVPSLALGARRLHDTGRSGWWQFLGLIPCVGTIFLIVWWASAPTVNGDKYNR
jgi:uncharacterized membrane protein YhaH (DUF805 family)